MLLWVVIACSKGSDTGELNCNDAPQVTYHNFGEAFLRHNCQGCHASSTENRYGAPESVSFDNIELVWNWKNRILATTIGDSATMPPAGKITDDESVMVYWWLECGKEGE
jgi:hypothetical protein